MRTRTAVAAALLLLSAVACVGGKSQASAEDKERLKAYILDAVPPGVKKVDINFENRVRVIGVKVEPELAPPGTVVKATYYWRCEDPLDDGWQLFTHLEHEGLDKKENLDGVGPLRESRNGKQVLGPDRWERNKIYADEQTFTMPAELKGPDSVIYVGIWKGDARLRVLNGPNDGDNRAIMAKVKTGIAPKKEEKRGLLDVPQLKAEKLAVGEKIVIDGKGDEKAWATAASTGPFVDVGTGRPATSAPVTGSAKVTWDDDNVYFLVDIKDETVTGYFTDKASQPKDWTATGQPMTWTKDTAELMIDPDGDGDNVNYYELQINPANKVFKSQFDAYNAPKTEPQGPFGHEDWDPKMKSAVVVHGTIDKPGDKDEGYTVEVAIPWKAFEKGAKQLPPKAGDTWRVNMYAMENNGGTAWSAILGQGNFHKSARFGKITWATKEWLISQKLGELFSDAGPDNLQHGLGGEGGTDPKDGGKPLLPPHVLVTNEAGAVLRKPPPPPAPTPKP